MDQSIRLQKVSKTYTGEGGAGIRAADQVTLELPLGRSTTFVGASGSGKSTLLHLIGAIDYPDSGTIIVDGLDVTGLTNRERVEYRSRVGFVFQGFHLIGSLTVLENVCVPLIGRLSLAERRRRALEVLESVDMAPRAGALPSQLSGGQQQRVAIARALVVEPTIVLADEPTGNLDSVNTAEVMRMLRELGETWGTTLLLATHDEALAASCDVRVHVADGRASLVDGMRTVRGHLD